MKKIIMVCLVSILLIFSLTGCKSEESSDRADKKDSVKVEENDTKDNEDEEIEEIEENDTKENEEDEDEDNKDNEEDKKGSTIKDWLTGGDFDASGYVESCLDLLTKGETKEYMKITKRTQEQADDDYEANLDAMVDSMGVDGISDELKEGYRDFFKELYSKSKYDVKSSEKMSGEDGYTVTVEIQQITGLFNGLDEELVEKSQELITEETSFDELNEIVFQTMLDLMKDRLDKITYSDPRSITVDVVADSNKVYSITNKGYEAINDALISVEGLE